MGTTTTASKPVIDTAPLAPFEWLLASRYLRPKRKDGLISIIAIIAFLGIMVGVATLIAVLGVMNGFREELYARLLGINGHVEIFRFGGDFKDVDATIARLLAVPSVRSVVPVVTGEALMTNADKEVGSLAVYIRGMRGNDIDALRQSGAKFDSGSLAGFDGSETIILGKRLAKSLDVAVGGTVQLLTHRGRSTVFGIKPNNKAYRVVALVDFGMAEADNVLAYLPFTEAQAFFVLPDAISKLDVKVDRPEQIGALLEPLQQAAGIEYVLRDWRQTSSEIFGIIDTQRDLMSIIVSLIVLVAALNIISGMMMLVKQKTKAIAILRTMGVTQAAIMRIFLLTGASIGLAGTLAGLAAGLLLAYNVEAVRGFIQWLTGRTIYDPNVYLISKLVARVDPWETVAIVAMALSLSVAATLYPSWRAARLDPVKALRNE
jgi:lipoprotein-releasing system permease protein